MPLPGSDSDRNQWTSPLCPDRDSRTIPLERLPAELHPLVTIEQALVSLPKNALAGLAAQYAVYVGAVMERYTTSVAAKESGQIIELCERAACKPSTVTSREIDKACRRATEISVDAFRKNALDHLSDDYQWPS